MKEDDDFWSWKHLRPDSWTDLVTGVTVMGMMLVLILGMTFLLIIAIDITN